MFDVRTGRHGRIVQVPMVQECISFSKRYRGGNSLRRLKPRTKPQLTSTRGQLKSRLETGFYYLPGTFKLKGKTGTFKPKYVGPFPILRMVGDNACELKLPEAMKIHPVVYVSQVKKYHGSL